MGELLLLFISTHSALGLHLAVQGHEEELTKCTYIPTASPPQVTHNDSLIHLKSRCIDIFVHAPNIDSTLKILIV